MSTVHLSTKQWAEYHKRLAKSFWPTIRRGLVSSQQRVRAAMIEATAKAPPASSRGSTGAFNLGTYKRSWKATAKLNQLIVFNPVPYAGVIEWGRRPGKRRPPIRPILHWVMRKLRVRGAEASRIAWAVAQSIAKRGLRGRHVLTDQEEHLSELILKEVEHELDRALEGKGHA